MRVIRIVKRCNYATVKKKKQHPRELNKIQGFKTNVEHRHKIFLSHKVSPEEYIICPPNTALCLPNTLAEEVTPNTNSATAPIPKWL